MPSYYRIDLHPLAHMWHVAGTYIVAAAIIVAVELAVRQVRRWANRPRLYDWQRDLAAISDLASDIRREQQWDRYLGARARTRIDRGLSPVDQSVQSQLWPNVIPLREVMNVNDRHPAA